MAKAELLFDNIGGGGEPITDMNFKWVGSVPSGRTISLDAQPKRLILHYYNSSYTESEQIAYFDVEHSSDYSKFMRVSNYNNTPTEVTMTNTTMIASISGGVITMGTSHTGGSQVWVLWD